MVERTLSIIKPDAVKSRQAGEILSRIEKSGFGIAGLRHRHLTRAEAEGFYAVHRERPFYAGLVKFMTEGPVVPIALEREDAIAALRKLMGDTNPEKAPEGSIRKRFGSSIERNSIHGSDAPETAAFEIGYFFSEMEILS